MATGSDLAARTVVVGANHRSSSLGLRDRLFVEDDAVPGFLQAVRGAGIAQALVMSTCDRVEVQAIHDDPQAASRGIVEALAAHGEIAPAALDGGLYVLSGEAAVHHIFSVASSLDSLVIGEPQVLGQIKASHRAAQSAGVCGGDLESVLQAAYATAKRVRTETAIGERPVTIAAAVAQLAGDLHGDLSRHAAILVGAGDLGELIVEALVAHGLRELSVTHPTEPRAEEAARLLDCHVTPFEALADRLPQADIVVATLGARRHTVTAEMVRAALKARRNRPVFLVDAGIPGDIEPEVDRLGSAFLYTIDDLERVAMQGRASREAEGQAARDIVDAELQSFLRGRAERQAAPTVTALRRHFETVRDDVLRSAGDDAERATRLLVNRLLHGPSRTLREIAADDGRAEDLDAADRVLRQLFDLEAGDGNGP